MLTNKQERLLYFINQYQQEHGGSPTLREMVVASGAYDTKSVSGIIASLEKKGLLFHKKGHFRSVWLTPTAKGLLRLSPLSYRGDIGVQEDAVSSPASETLPSSINLKHINNIERNDVTVLASTSDFVGNSKHALRTNGTDSNYWPEAIRTVASMLSHLMVSGTSGEGEEPQRRPRQIIRHLLVALSLLPPIIALAGTGATGLLWFALVYCLVITSIHVTNH